MRTNAAPTPPADPNPRRRRWWLYVVIGFIGLILLAGTGFLGLAAYYHSLVKRYTATEPVQLEALSVEPHEQEALKQRWFRWHQNVAAGRPSPPMRMTADDLNVLVASNPDLRQRVRLGIEDEFVRADFSIPLDDARKKELKGRHLNGTALLELKLADDGFPSLQVASLRVNGQPPPGWFASRFVTGRNFFKEIGDNPHLFGLINGIESIDVGDGQIVISPFNLEYRAATP